ncbi:MAG TPA: twin-arginine translocase subunit TatC [Chromatiales bacterium]|nr:twin-arginine translocase subunit TatC [Thiotrichales bacterium]HIP66957.1 twin-arginine translocase subunit TatC [Chromatiales bacterium]
MSQNPETENNMKETGLLSHLLELRDRLLRMVIAIAIALLALFPFRNTIYSFLAEPLTKHLPEDSSMIAIDVASSFLAPFKLVLMLSVVAVVPFLMHQIWGFIAPGLYKREKRLAVPLLLSSIALFYIGMAFAYFVVFPLVFGFFTSVAPEGVQIMTDINRYLDFVIKLFLAFGFSFEVPIATFLIIVTGMSTVEKLSKARPYIIVVAFILGMLLTPPDIISQILLAVPIWLLFEIGLQFSRWFAKPPEEETPTAEKHEEYEPIFDIVEEEDTFKPMTDEEMEAEMDRIEAEEDSDK